MSFGNDLHSMNLVQSRLGRKRIFYAISSLRYGQNVRVPYAELPDPIDELAATVKEISEVPDQCKVGEENLDLCREAMDWDGRLADLAHEIRCRVREAEGKPAPDTDRPLAADIREADRIARRLADHHPDPEARRLYRQLVEHAESKRGGGCRSGRRGALSPLTPPADPP